MHRLYLPRPRQWRGRFPAGLNGSVPHGPGQAPFASEPDRTSGESEAKSLPPSSASIYVQHRMHAKKSQRISLTNLDSPLGKMGLHRLDRDLFTVEDSSGKGGFCIGSFKNL